ncbi:MAG: 4-hydroxyphenylpyruvate dioxygenase [Planctomycetota bacterium]|nr:MAG: 4-hydroxyphenylpyruvate dioxygenase [Planctomycetota bacterium]
MSQGLKRVHHVEFVVGNAKQAAFFYRKGFGFDQVAYRGPETGCADRASYVMKQNDITLILTSPLRHDDPLSTWLMLHGDGVYDIALEVNDLEAVYGRAIAAEARSCQEIGELSGDDGKVRVAGIHAYGELRHSLIQKDGYEGFLPGFVPSEIKGESAGLVFIDHIVGNLSFGQMNLWVDWYDRVLGLTKFVSYDDKDISTEYSALQSTVVASADRTIKFPLNEPAKGKKKSQIQEYIDSNLTAGAQHLALRTDDILATIKTLRSNGIEFLAVPEGYYDNVWKRVGVVQEDKDAIKDLRILVDKDDNGYLLQVFTRPLQDRPTFFIEIIQRAGSDSFGKGNFKALFETIEQEQRQRGNL